MDDWMKRSQIGIFLGEDTFTPVRFLHNDLGTGRIKWKYMRPFSGERELKNIPKTVLGHEYNLYTNDKKFPTKVQIFHMDINGNPVLNHLPPSVLRVNELLKSQNEYFKTLISDMRKELYDRSNKDKLMKEAIRLGGFRKDFIDAGITGAEQFGSYSPFSRFGMSSGLGLPPRTI